MNNDSRQELRMDAYYYSFERTGNDAIDKILSAVACAGKAYHNTESWLDEDGRATYCGHKGKSPVEWIQNAANEASRQSLEGQYGVKECLEKISELCPPDPDLDQLDESRGNLERLHNAEVGDTARAALAMLESTPPSAIEIRNGALEEAADICKNLNKTEPDNPEYGSWGELGDVAKAIRALIKPSGES